MQIYTLSCPLTNEVKYVGFTSKKDLKFRYKEHLRDKRKTKKNSWVKSLLNKEKIPIIESLEEVNKDNWKEREVYWISQFKAWGFNLKNSTNGGEGAFGCKHSFEQKKANSLRNKGKIVSEETKLKISKSNKGRIISEQTRLKISKSHIGLKNSLETKKKISKANKGKIITEETRNKISKKLKGLKREFKERKRSRKSILQFDLNNIFIKEFGSIKEASKETNILRTSISNNLKKLSKKAGKFIWEYKNK